MTAPNWPTCEQCSAVRAAGYNRCLNHLKPNELDQFLTRLEPGSDLDARGTTITDELLARLVDAVGRTFGEVNFTGAQFTGRTGFDSVEVRNGVFSGAEFEAMEEFGPLLARSINLDKATFSKWLWIEITSHRTTCAGTNFAAGVSLRVECGLISATSAVFGARSTIIENNRSWPVSDHWRKDLPAARPKLMSLRETDVGNLVLVDIGLSSCRFAGAHRLDQLRIEGELRFGMPTDRWQTRRLMLIEENFARHPGRDRTGIGPERVAALYRSLRKAFEDSKNEAGAGDFYYGEMEMRRRAVSTRPSEKLILWAYWALSGYGQRAGRAVAWLVALVAIVCITLFTVGLPGEVVWTWGRVDQSLRIGMGAVVFREAGQALTSAGNWTVMGARFAGPVLLALAILAIRARVKR